MRGAVLLQTGDVALGGPAPGKADAHSGKLLLPRAGPCADDADRPGPGHEEPDPRDHVPGTGPRSLLHAGRGDAPRARGESLGRGHRERRALRPGRAAAAAGRDPPPRGAPPDQEQSPGDGGPGGASACRTQRSGGPAAPLGQPHPPAQHRARSPAPDPGGTFAP